MKLLIFCPYYPPHIGGLESHADEFNKYLSQKGVDITVFTPRLPAEAPENEVRHHGVKIIRFPAFEFIPGYPLPKFWKLEYWRLYVRFYFNEYDLIISRTRFFFTSLLALEYAKIKKRKWMHIEHGSDFVRLNNKFHAGVARLHDLTLSKIIFNSCDLLIANSQASAKFCHMLASARPCEVIYRGVESEYIENIQSDIDTKKKYQDKLILVFLGRLISGKGVSDLITAVSGLENKLVLLVIGDGPERNNLELFTKKLNLQNNVVFFGNKIFDKAISILKIADIVVNPSYTEGLPTSIIEAAICRKAIIATNVGGTKEIIKNGESGFLVEAGDIDLLKEKLEILIKNEDIRNQFGNFAYQEVKNKFDWNKNILKYLNVFE